MPEYLDPDMILRYVMESVTVICGTPLPLSTRALLLLFLGRPYLFAAPRTVWIVEDEE